MAQNQPDLTPRNARASLKRDKQLGARVTSEHRLMLDVRAMLGKYESRLDAIEAAVQKVTKALEKRPAPKR